MKQLILLIAFALFSSFVLVDHDGRKLPSVKVKSLKGIEVDIATFTNNNKPILILVMEVTCKTSVSELSEIADLYDEWQKETGVKIIGISIDDTRSSPKLASMIVSKDWPFEFYTDVNQDFKRAMNIPYCPFCFVVDGKGNVVWQKGGYVSGDEDIIFDVLNKVSRGESLK